MMKLLSNFPLILMLLVITAFTGEKTITLELNLEQGADYTININNKQHLVTMVGDKKMENKTSMIVDLNWKVNRKYGRDSTLIEASYNHFLMDVDAGSNQFHIDSKETDTNPNKYFHSLITLMHNHPVTFKTNAQGEMLDIRGVDDLRKATRDSLPNVPESAQKMLDKLLTVDALKSTFNITAIYPKKPVAVGDTWENDLTVNNIASLRLHQKFTLKSFTPENAVLSVSTRIESAKDSISLNGMTLPVQVQGTRSGQYTLDRATGLLTNGTVDEQLEIRMSIKGQNFVINTTGENQISETRKDQ